jgi:hypothetical protein
VRNTDLLRDLKDIDRLARKTQADKEYTIEAADRELNEAKVQQLFYLFIYLFIYLRLKFNIIIEKCNHSMLD